MSKRPNAVPLKNITNRQQGKRGTGLTDSEMDILESHRLAEEREICSMAKYRDKIIKYYEELDKVFCFEEKDITYEMRSILLDWIVSCCEKLSLSDDTLHACAYLIDRFLSGRAISPSKLQLVGLTGLVLAAKYEEVICPELCNFLLLSDNTFTEIEIKKAEKYMLYALGYSMEFVSPLYFLRRASRANNYEVRSRKMAKYFVELMMLEKCFECYRKRVVAAAAMYLARKICHTDFNKGLFFHYARVDRGSIKECFERLVKIVYSPPKYENVERKYAGESMHCVSKIAREYAQKSFG